MKRVYGFTLIELVVTMFILAIIVAAAAPSFNGVMQNVQIDSATSKVRSALSFARSTAVSEQADVTICSSSDQATCTAETDWTAGWIVFIDENGNGAFDDGTPATVCEAGADCIQRVWEALPSGSTLNATVGTATPPTAISSIVFAPDGRLDSATLTNLELKVDECGTGDLRDLSISPIGRVQITTGNC